MPALASTTVEDMQGLIDIGNQRRLYLECRGDGGPTVILESGYRNNADVWTTDLLQPDAPRQMVLPGVAEFTRVCAYDRPGTLLDAERRGRSAAVPMPRTAAAAVADLHALLTAAGIPGPYVLVGHSYGGILIRLYAATYPDEVAGLVLVDPSHEDQNERFLAVLTPDEQAAMTRLEAQLPPELADYADLEGFDFAASSAEMHAAPPLSPAMPLILLTRGTPFAADDPAEWEGIAPAGIAAVERESQAMDNELASLTPGARHLIAHKSGHFIQLDEPKLVIEAVRDVVEAVRNRRDTEDQPAEANTASTTTPATPLMTSPILKDVGS